LYEGVDFCDVEVFVGELQLIPYWWWCCTVCISWPFFQPKWVPLGHILPQICACHLLWWGSWGFGCPWRGVIRPWSDG